MEKGFRKLFKFVYDCLSMKNELNLIQIKKELENSKEKIRNLGVKKIGVFGSFAKNKQTSKSDIDIIVKFNKITLKNYMGLLQLLKKIFNRKVDLVIEQDLKPELRYVKKEMVYVKI